MRRSYIFTAIAGGLWGLVLGINGVHYYMPGFWLFLVPIVFHGFALRFARAEGP